MDEPANTPTNDLAVEFVLPETEATAAPIEVPNLRCDCSSKEFILAHEMFVNSARGGISSRMYECKACGAYQLGK